MLSVSALISRFDSLGIEKLVVKQAYFSAFPA